MFLIHKWCLFTAPTAVCTQLCKKTIFIPYGLSLSAFSKWTSHEFHRLRSLWFQEMNSSFYNESDYSWTQAPAQPPEQDDYTYDYDIEEAVRTFFWPELLPTLLVYGLTFLLGLIGNALIIFTISVYRRMKSTTNLFLASLASADLLLILCCIPVKVRLACFLTVCTGVGQGNRAKIRQPEKARSGEEQSVKCC